MRPFEPHASTPQRGRARRALTRDGWLEAAWLAGNVAGFVLLGYTVADHLDETAPVRAVELPEIAPDAAES